jgi:hypothetical protein
MSASETPLSDLMSDHTKLNTAETHARFVEAFRRSRLGVVAVGVPEGTTGDVVSTSQNPVAVGMTQHAAGRPMALAFADPAAFAQRFGQRFNAEMAGESLLATVLHNPGCEGVLVNSAIPFQGPEGVTAAFADGCRKSRASGAGEKPHPAVGPGTLSKPPNGLSHVLGPPWVTWNSDEPAGRPPSRAAPGYSSWPLRNG